MRAKFICTSKTETMQGIEVTLHPVVNGSEENKKFFKYTPYGDIKIGTINQDAAAEIVIGAQYYVDFTKAE
jgi:hypothetical protein